MKRIYLAGALIIASGAAIGFLLRPPGPAPVAAADADKPGKPATEHARYYTAPALNVELPPALNFAAANRPDCFYLRVAYAYALKPDSGAGDAQTLRRRGADSGCWIAEN